MSSLQIRRLSDDLVIANSVYIADTFCARLRGLIPLADLDRGSAWLLIPGGSIHTCFMKFTIDVLFLDQNFTVLDVCQGVSPWCFRMAPAGTKKVLEMSSGNGPVKFITALDRLIIEPAATTKESLK